MHVDVWLVGERYEGWASRAVQAVRADKGTGLSRSLRDLRGLMTARWWRASSERQRVLKTAAAGPIRRARDEAHSLPSLCAILGIQRDFKLSICW